MLQNGSLYDPSLEQAAASNRSNGQCQPIPDHHPIKLGSRWASAKTQANGIQWNGLPAPAAYQPIRDSNRLMLALFENLKIGLKNPLEMVESPPRPADVVPET